MKNWQITGFLAILILGFLLMSGCTSPGTTSAAPVAVNTPTPQIVYVTVLVTPTLSVVPKAAEPTKNQDAMMDTAFVTYMNDNKIMDGMTELMRSSSMKEAVRLNGLLVKAPSPGSEKMKTYRSAMMNALAQIDGSTAGPSRYLNAMRTVIDTGTVAIDQYTEVESGTPVSGSTHLTGYGDDVVSFTATGSGLRIFTMRHTGSSNFAIILKDGNGKYLTLLVNEIGSYSGKKSQSLTTGKYYLDVTADGTWTVDITSV
ncbi:MAG: hypothetical protein NTW33_00665 [Methanoregula sp.]|nr:hypothetical protein [Methanoregula sp.]